MKFFDQFKGLKLTARAHNLGGVLLFVASLLTFLFIVRLWFGPICEI